MTDLNKLREEFEQLPDIKDLIKESSAEWRGSYFYFTEDDYALGYLNGAWYYYREQQAKFNLYMNDFTVAANCVKSMRKTVEQLQAQLDKLESGDYVLVPKEPTKEIIDTMHDSFLGAFIDGKATGGQSIEFAYKAMIAAAQEQNDD